MILDAILVALSNFLLGILAMFAGVINLILGLIEAILQLLLPKFKLPRVRVGREKKDGLDTAGEEEGEVSNAENIFFLKLIVGCMALAWVLYLLLFQTVTLVAKDGHSLPYAAVILHTSTGDHHERTDDAGNFKILRFFTDGVTVKDPRYVEKTWRKEEIESILVVQRTVLGAGLDSLAEKLMKPAREE